MQFDEKYIVEGCKKSNKIAQRELYERYSQVMYAICRRYVTNFAEAKDVMHEGFIKILSKIRQYKGNGSFEGWMKRIMINTSISHYHKNKKHFAHLDEMDENAYIEDTGTNVEDSFMEVDKTDISLEEINVDMVRNANFTRDELISSLDKIPQPYSIVFNLHILEGLKHKEIADLLKIDEKTSRTRLLRARKQLQKVLYQLSVDKLGK